jgi:Domain of unknown function (DUF4129)
LCLVAPLLATKANAQPGQQRTPGSAPLSEFDLKAYEAQLDRCAGQISKVRRQPAELARLRKTIAPEWTVRAGQTDVSVSTNWLSTALAQLADHPKEADERARAINARLAAMREAAAQFAESPPAPNEARAHLDAILQRREFSGLHGPTELQILEARIARRIASRLPELLARFHLGAKAGNIFGWIVIGIAFSLLCWWLWRRLAVRAPAQKAETGQRLATSTTSPCWLEEALAAADRGDYREAVHCAYWAVIARLEDSGSLSRDRARTPRESLRQLGSHAAERAKLERLTRSFELLWYGDHPASAADWTGARAQLEDMGCLKRSTAVTVIS